MKLILKNVRKTKKFTQAQIAKNLNITVRQYQNIEAGTCGTSEENWLKLFNLFGQEIPLHKLMENTFSERNSRE